MSNVVTGRIRKGDCIMRGGKGKNGERVTENMTCRKTTGRTRQQRRQAGKMGQEKREVHVTGRKMKGRKEVRIDVKKGSR